QPRHHGSDHEPQSRSRHHGDHGDARSRYRRLCAAGYWLCRRPYCIRRVEQGDRLMLYEAIKLALQAILRNALRSFLTMMGIMIGVGAVIAMVTIGNGTTAKVAADLAKLGSN